MGRSPSSHSYDRIAVALHWTVAALIVAVGAVGLLFGNVLHGAKAYWLNLHAIVGLVLFALVLVRTAWRLTHPAPPLENVGSAARQFAKLMHLAMYVLMVAIPAIGLVSFLWHGRVFDLGVLKIVPGITPDRAIYHPTQTLHAWLTYSLMALLALHMAASLWHHFVLRDGLLARMGLGIRRSQNVAG